MSVDSPADAGAGPAPSVSVHVAKTAAGGGAPLFSGQRAQPLGPKAFKAFSIDDGDPQAQEGTPLGKEARISPEARAYNQTRGDDERAICYGDATNLVYPFQDDDTWVLALSANDDGSAGPIALPFTFVLYEDYYTQCWINNNGNLSFTGAYSTYSPVGFPSSSYVMVAPFWADVDTRAHDVGSGLVWYKFVDGNGDSVYETLVVTWDNVGYFGSHTDRLNTFQVALSDGTNPAMGLGNTVCFSYDNMCWTTGDVDGSGGFGGEGSTVGCNRGNGVDYFQIGRFNHEGTDYDGPYEDADGVSWLDGQQICVNTGAVNIPPVPQGFPAGYQVNLAPVIGEVLDLTLQFLSPEDGQTTTVGLADPDGAQDAGLVIDNSPGNPAQVHLTWETACSVAGTYLLEFTAVDDFMPAGVSVVPLTVHVGSSNDCNNNGEPDECDVAVGPSLDCNANEIPDECDVAAGTSPDCNLNGVPDECDLVDGFSEDCTLNGVPDECDIAAGTSPDCNLNSVPDECDVAGGAERGDVNGDGFFDQADMDLFIAGLTGLVDDEELAERLDFNEDGLMDGRDIQLFAGWYIAAGAGRRSSEDCNANGIPDECEIDANSPAPGGPFFCTSQPCDADCNVNGIPDECDIADGTSPDCEPNGIPDDCEVVLGSEAVVWELGDDSVAQLSISGQAAWDSYSQSSLIPEPMYTGAGDQIQDWAGYWWSNCMEWDPVTGECLWWWEEGATAQSQAAYHCDGQVETRRFVFRAMAYANAWLQGPTGNIWADSTVQANLFLVCEDPALPPDSPVSLKIEVSGGGYAYSASTTYLLSIESADDALTLSETRTNGGTYAWGDTASNSGLLLTRNGEALTLAFTYVGQTQAVDWGGDCSVDMTVWLAVVQDCNETGDPDHCDIAAGVSQDCTANGIPDECEPDCNANGVADSCDIANGTVQDCNGNGVPDECDIAAGLSPDCQLDGVPDECQLVGNDCNHNGVPDDCDLATGTSEDCTGNGIPDECEPDCNGNDIADSCDLADGTSTDCQPDGTPDECQLVGNDCNGNDLPDECDIAGAFSEDCTGNGIPDECEPDCNENGAADSCDIDEGISEDCNHNGVPDECDVTGGLSDDCNGNGIPDECDIAAGTSEDCNGNGNPDECDVIDGTSQDCNTNGIPDECDIAAGTSEDCNLNGSPDECDVLDGTSEDCNANGIPDECEIVVEVPIVEQEPVDLWCDVPSQDFAWCYGFPEYNVKLWDDFSVVLDSALGEGRAWFVGYDYPVDGMPFLVEVADGPGGAEAGGNVVLSASGIGEGANVVRWDFSGAVLPAGTWWLSVQAATWSCEYDMFMWIQSSPYVPNGSEFYIHNPSGAWGFGADPIPGSSVCGMPGDLACMQETTGTNDCNGNGVLDECDIADGTSYDCQPNGVPDECDIASGTSLDEDGNGLPDECPDADGDGVPDVIDECPGTPLGEPVDEDGCGCFTQDSEDPILADCPGDMTQAANLGECGAVVTWMAPVGEDNCSVVSLTSDYSPGDLFPVGTTGVTYTAEDGAGNTALCSFSVTVTDEEDPVILGCPDSIAQTADVGVCGAVVTWAEPTAVDNCSVASVGSDYSSGELFPVGTTTVTYAAEDGAGNTGTCNFSVTVTDDEAPVMSGCPGSIAQTTDAGTCGAVVTWAEPTADDNCGVAGFTSDHNPGDLFPVGTTTVTYTAEDGAAGTAVCSFDVTITDGEAPTITDSPALVEVPADASCEGTVPDVTARVAATDNCDDELTVTQDVATGTALALGSPVDVQVAVTDDEGLSSTCMITVALVDGTPPAFTRCEDVTVESVIVPGGPCEAAVDVSAQIAVVDNCDASPGLSCQRDDGLACTDPYPCGATAVTWTATDQSGNSAACALTVTVNAASGVYVTVELDGVQASGMPTLLDRCITFELYCCESAEPPCGPFAAVVVEEMVTFTDGVGSTTLHIPGGPYSCITARDGRHTLRRTIDPLPDNGIQYLAEFVSTNAEALIPGNLNDDDWIDVIDFALLAGQWGACYDSDGDTVPDGGTPCEMFSIHADLDGDGCVTDEDVTLAQLHMLTPNEWTCCEGEPLRGGGPVERISITDLQRLGIQNAAAGDLNRDGWLDVDDIILWKKGVRPTVVSGSAPARASIDGKPVGPSGVGDNASRAVYQGGIPPQAAPNPLPDAAVAFRLTPAMPPWRSGRGLLEGSVRDTAE